MVYPEKGLPYYSGVSWLHYNHRYVPRRLLHSADDIRSIWFLDIHQGQYPPGTYAFNLWVSLDKKRKVVIEKEWGEPQTF